MLLSNVEQKQVEKGIACTGMKCSQTFEIPKPKIEGLITCVTEVLLMASRNPKTKTYRGWEYPRYYCPANVLARYVATACKVTALRHNA